MCAWFKGILSLLWEKDSFLYIAGNVMLRDDPCVPPNSISANDFVLWIVRTMYLAITENLRAWTTSTEPPLWWPQIFRSWFKMSPPCKGCWSMLIHRSARTCYSLEIEAWSFCVLAKLKVLNGSIHFWLSGWGVEGPVEAVATLHWSTCQRHRRTIETTCRCTGCDNLFDAK